MSDSILKKIEDISTQAKKSISESNRIEDLENIKIQFLGRKSELTEILRSIKDLPKEEKIIAGKESNRCRLNIESAYEEKHNKLKKALLTDKINLEWRDVTYPPEQIAVGSTHPITSMIAKAEDIFINMGFEVVYPFEVDSEFNNFTAVNIPDNHPAKDMWDTFWTEDNNVMITHTSSMQHRVLKSTEPPIRAIVPGKTFRREATDARHEHTFYQLEGIYVDRGINLSHMIGTIKEFFSNFFEKEMDVMFTPDFFPFVEPGGMISINTKNLQGNFDKVTKGTGWLEVLGCGMIHPNVLKQAGIDPNVYSGFAWGVGVERLIMLKYEIDDIRLFQSGDLRFIRQFK
jgi:phenylalanyl-tRNA synthetase alpha chain